MPDGGRLDRGRGGNQMDTSGRGCPRTPMPPTTVAAHPQKRLDYPTPRFAPQAA